MPIDAAGMTSLVIQSAGVPESAWGMVTGSAGLTKAVLLLLVALSVISWAIMYRKWREFRQVTGAGAAFMSEFERVPTVDEASALAQRTPSSPFTGVFARAELFLQQTRPAMAATSDRAGRLSGSQVEALRLVLDAQTGAERDRLAQFVPWLATIGSVSPLIGLLGTVLGVIQAFLGIAREGAGNIGAVAPGVAEALIATAAALAVAIPAVFGYNLFAQRLNRLESELDGFGSELIALLVREGRI